MQNIVFLSDGNKLSGTLFVPVKQKNSNPAILFVHGWTSEKKRSCQYAESLIKLGYICFLFDMRGHGESEGDINTATTEEFSHDVLASYDYLAGVEGVDKENISVVGSSFGSYLGTLLTEKRKVTHLALRVPADYPDESFNKMKMGTSGQTNEEVLAWRRNPKKPGDTFALTVISKFSGEILIIESGEDKIVLHQTVQNYADAVSDKNKLTHVVIAGAPHSIKHGPFKDQVEKILLTWFRKRI
ncbi:MAG: hypothetical protein UT63_C0068G0012 [Candidatus Gottesmanbacteria bacterium GW2011_GWC2_39_8]|uniref:AB hydrolase-1 domain-containing protein n=1 Tax=Candidatus Gottesmanbacteria bacterium GW2011_GWC2_39_8 TaxID=1618450 RepID=A0A0G0T0W3_9BACT|nr:MAG: hypothetical protein UT63_C0068G0012 [Candidatus Gottesmanbacteria bacterium GW2011_GWC2_39_8]